MKLKKVANLFDTYSAELSYGELLAIRDALAKDHCGPLCDELNASIQFFVDRLPGPGDEDSGKGEAGKEETGKAPKDLASLANDLKTPDEELDLERELRGGAEPRKVASQSDLDRELPAPEEEM